MDYKEFFVDLDIIKLKIFFDEKKNKILKTEIIDDNLRNFNKSKNFISESIKKYFYGDIDKFDLSLINFDEMRNFQKDTLIKLSEIPRGKVITYKGLAESVGKEKAYRAVGTSLARNPFPIIIPCHRVIKSNLDVGNFGKRMDLKIKLLKFEGIIFQNDNFISKEFVL
ncbi:MAG: methylated-DNA--[protein]-cysteine S-methyltransferase [Caldisericia bacterium]